MKTANKICFDVHTVAQGIQSQVQSEAMFRLTQGLLRGLVHCKRIVPYSEVSPLAGFHHRDPRWHTLLGRVMVDDNNDGVGLTPSVVINKELGRPGDQYFKLLGELGRPVSEHSPDLLKVLAWKEELKRLGLDA